MFAYIRKIDGEITTNPDIGILWFARGCSIEIIYMQAAI